MKQAKFDEIINHVWAYREYLRPHADFDYPFYGGLKNKMGVCSSEAVDAMQNIWADFQAGKFKTRQRFASAYKQELRRIGELVK